MADSPDVTVGRRFICVFCLVLPVGGCVRGGRITRPEGALTAYGAALANGDADRAWSLLAPADQARLPIEDFRRAVRENPAEAHELGDQLQHAKAVVRAEAALKDGSAVGLVGTGDGFRLEDPLSRFYGQSSPRAALFAFVRAVERARWDVVVRLMPSASRVLPDQAIAAQLAAQKAELERVAARLWAARDQPIELVGDRATLPYAESFTARFVREDGLWRVESPE